MAAPIPPATQKKTRLPRAAAIGRSTFPYLAGAIFAASIMAWYFFFVVPKKLDYFVGLRFRTLAVAAAQVKSKVESLKASLDGAVAPLEGSVGPGKEIFIEKTADYLSTLVPDLKPPQRYGSGLALLQDYEFPQIPTTVAWADVVASAADASRRDFNDLVLATKDGKVVWQRERTTHRVGSIKELLSTEPDQTRWSLNWQVRTTLPKKEPRELSESAVLTPVNVGGVSSYLFVQPVNIAPGANLPDTFYLAGIVSSATLEQQARHVPRALVILVASPILLLFLALPFIKLATLTPKERYSFGDILFLSLATLCGIGLGASLLLGPAAAGSGVDGTLEKLARTINQRFGDETGRVLRLATAIQLREADFTQGYLQDCVSQLDFDDTGSLRRCGLWQALEQLGITTSQDEPLDRDKVKTGSVELDIAAWVNRDGMQVQKWTTKTAITTLVSHRQFTHFQNLVAGHTWTLKDKELSPARFTIDPLRSPTTAEMGFIFGVPAIRRDHFFFLNVRPQSVVDAVVPPGYGFAVLAADGSVLFHSEESLSLAENFLAEVDRPDLVRASATSEKGVTWSGDYHGRPHRLRIQAVDAFVDCPWRIVTFKESDPVLEAQFQQHNAALRLGALNVLALLALAGLYGIYSAIGHRSIRDFPLTPGSTTWMSMIVIGGVTVVAIALLAYTYFPSANRHVDFLYRCFVALPVIAAIMAVAARHNPVSPHLTGWWRIGEVLLLFVVLGAAPAIGLARIAFCVQDTRDTEAWLESARHRWEARRARLMERVRVPVYDTESYQMLRGRHGFAKEWTPLGPDDKEPPFSYLAQVENVQVLGRPATDAEWKRIEDAPLSWDGQRFVRNVLTWTPAETSESDPKIRTTVESPHLRLPPRDRDDPSPVFAVALAHGPGTDLSPGRTFLGFMILTAAALALCWAWRRLTPPSFAPADGISDQIPLVSPRGHEGVLLIGPPRMDKDDTLAREIEKHTHKPVATRIQLISNSAQADLDDALARVNQIAGECTGTGVAADWHGRLWIQVSNLESQLVGAESRKQVLVFLERLLDKGKNQCSRVIAITSSIDPIANFDEIFQEERQGIYDDAVPEVELNRSSLLLSRFHRCYKPMTCETRARQRWSSWLNYKPADWRDTLDAETHGYPPLARIAAELSDTAWPSDPSIDDLARVITDRAQSVYELLWTSCTRSEKLVLIQLAQEGVVNPKCYDVVARLVAKGIVIPVPGLTVFNYTFRRFLRGIERDRVVQEWERMEGTGLWVSAGRLVGSSMLLGGVFFLLTQGWSVQTILPIVSGTSLFGVPVVRDLLTKVAAGPDKARAA